MDPKKLDEMIADSGLKKKEIQARTGMNAQMLYDLRQPQNASRLTRDKVMKIAKAIGMNPVKYFPELDKDVMLMAEEPAAVYQANKISAKVTEYFEDLMLKMDTYRDDYIQSLKYNIQLQEQVIEMMKEKQ